MADGSPWLGHGPLLLASGSAIRKDLLERAGLPVEVDISGIDERGLEARLAACDAGEIAGQLADAKALAVSRRRPDRIVVGADQVLTCDERRFSKAPDREAARETLTRLAGRTHALHSAVTIARSGRIDARFVAEARLTMRPLGYDAIDNYLDIAGEAAFRSVGCYEIEGVGIHLFARIEGEHSTILGLPLIPLLAGLRELELVAS